MLERVSLPASARQSRTSAPDSDDELGAVVSLLDAMLQIVSSVQVLVLARVPATV